MAESSSSQTDIMEKMMEKFLQALQPMQTALLALASNNSQPSSMPPKPFTITQKTDPLPTVQKLQREFPRFGGGDPLKWLYEADTYFRFHNISDHQKLVYASMHLDGAASSWFQWMEMTNQVHTWTDFVIALKVHFGHSVSEDPIAEFPRLVQQGTIPESQLGFQRLGCENENNKHCKGTSVFDLCEYTSDEVGTGAESVQGGVSSDSASEEIRTRLCMTSPTSVTEAFRLDSMVEVEFKESTNLCDKMSTHNIRTTHLSIGDDDSRTEENKGAVGLRTDDNKGFCFSEYTMASTFFYPNDEVYASIHTQIDYFIFAHQVCLPYDENIDWLFAAGVSELKVLQNCEDSLGNFYQQNMVVHIWRDEFWLNCRKVLIQTLILSAGLLGDVVLFHKWKHRIQLIGDWLAAFDVLLTIPMIFPTLWGLFQKGDTGIQRDRRRNLSSILQRSAMSYMRVQSYWSLGGRSNFSLFAKQRVPFILVLSGHAWTRRGQPKRSSSPTKVTYSADTTGSEAEAAASDPFVHNFSYFKDAVWGFLRPHTIRGTVLGSTALELAFEWSAPLVFITPFVTLFAWVIATTKYLPDVKGDRKYQISTLATKFGVRNIAFLGSGFGPVNSVGSTLAAVYMPQAFRQGLMILAHTIWALSLTFQEWILENTNYSTEASMHQVSLNRSNRNSLAEFSGSMTIVYLHLEDARHFSEETENALQQLGRNEGSSTVSGADDLVQCLSLIQHTNMVILVGACPDNGRIVYVYTTNRSLNSRIVRRENTTPLQWQFRFLFVAATCIGLRFLHQPGSMMHHKLKTTNMLIACNFVRKVNNVGKAGLIPQSVADIGILFQLTFADGPFCCIDPEYHQIENGCTKSDIYSLGILFLHLVTAKFPIALYFQVSRITSKSTLRRKRGPYLGTNVLPKLTGLRQLTEASKTLQVLVHWKMWLEEKGNKLNADYEQLQNVVHHEDMVSLEGWSNDTTQHRARGSRGQGRIHNRMTEQVPQSLDNCNVTQGNRRTTAEGIKGQSKDEQPAEDVRGHMS